MAVLNLLAALMCSEDKNSIYQAHGVLVTDAMPLAYPGVSLIVSALQAKRERQPPSSADSEVESKRLKPDPDMAGPTGASSSGHATQQPASHATQQPSASAVIKPEVPYQSYSQFCFLVLELAWITMIAGVFLALTPKRASRMLSLT